MSLKSVKSLKGVKPGTWFTARILDVKAVGKIQKWKDSYYLCQDVQDGAECKDKLGFNYSWTVDDGFTENLVNNGVTDLKLSTTKLKVPVSLVIGGKEVKFSKNSITVGCTEVPNSIVLAVADKIKERSEKKVKKIK